MQLKKLQLCLLIVVIILIGYTQQIQDCTVIFLRDKGERKKKRPFPINIKMRLKKNLAKPES